jgi:hypothetical protein
MDIFKVEAEVPRLGQKRNALLTHAILATIFKIVSLGMYTAISSFFPCFRRTIEVILLNAVEYRL